jgi:hypothetical protein
VTSWTGLIYFNGLQPGNENVAMKVEHDTREARMIVDFSSIPDCEALVPMPSAVERLDERETQITVRRIGPGIFSASLADVEKDTVLRMDFSFAWQHSRVVEEV